MFQDRFDAAEKLVPLLEKYKNNANAIILAIPRGALELGYVLAKKLQLPLDVIFTKKIGFPGNPEYAIGAASERHVFLNPPFNTMPDLKDYITDEVKKIRTIIKERNETYRKGMSPFDIKDKIVLVVDDGIATGNTLLATIALIKEYHPKKIVVALPVAPAEALEKIKEQVDEVFCVTVPRIFHSVSQFYTHFEQVDDHTAIELLRKAHI